MAPGDERDEPRVPRGSRHEARRRALEILYEADLKERPVPTILAAHLAGDEQPPEYALALVRGVHRGIARIDELITTHAKGWTLGRMPIVDRNLLRIAVHELLDVEDVPTAVAINEAVELAKELSTDDSGRFINGVLARIAEEGPAAP
ncbi:MAG TPA: transcription antitermination factor NusB [Egibacteraceae bacterium]|nr:transcription antitermination factor NusB [Egibacteraceae bacterium]